MNEANTRIECDDRVTESCNSNNFDLQNIQVKQFDKDDEQCIEYTQDSEESSEDYYDAEDEIFYEVDEKESDNFIKEDKICNVDPEDNLKKADLKDCKDGNMTDYNNMDDNEDTQLKELIEKMSSANFNDSGFDQVLIRITDNNDLNSDFSDNEDTESSNDESADDGGDDNSEDEGDGDWITPQNIKEVKKQLSADMVEEKPVVVGCLTTDFAMQVKFLKYL